MILFPVACSGGHFIVERKYLVTFQDFLFDIFHNIFIAEKKDLRKKGFPSSQLNVTF